MPPAATINQSVPGQGAMPLVDQAAVPVDDPRPKARELTLPTGVVTAPVGHLSGCPTVRQGFFTGKGLATSHGR